MIAFVLFIAMLIALSVVQNRQTAVFLNAELGILVTSIPFQDDNFIYSGGNYYSVINKQDIGEILKKIRKLKKYLKNKIVTVCGQTGAGKSTLINKLDFNETMSLQKLKKQVDFVSGKSLINGQEIYMGYSKNFDDFVWIDGKKVNLQIASIQNGYVVGIPLILTGF